MSAGLGMEGPVALPEGESGFFMHMWPNAKQVWAPQVSERRQGSSGRGRALGPALGQPQVSASPHSPKLRLG